MTAYQAASADLKWRVSRTCDGGACVMVARHADYVIVGKASGPDGPTLAYTQAEWKEFIAGVKLGDFDDLAWDLLRISAAVRSPGPHGPMALP